MTEGQGLSVSEPQLWDLIPFQNTLHVLMIVCVALSAFWYYKRRHIFPLKGRGSRAILLCSCVYIAVLISTVVRGSLPCVVDVVVYCIGSHVACALYVYRVIVLLVRHDIAEEIQFGSKSSSGVSRSCLHHRNFTPFLKFRRWVVVLIIYGIIVGVLVMAASAAQGDNFKCRGIVGLVSNYILIGICAPVMLALSFKLRKFPSDGRKISVEFRCMAFCVVMSLIAQVLLLQLVSFAYYAMYIQVTVALALMFTSLLFPVYLSYGYAGFKRNSSSSIAGASVLDEFLQSDEFRAAFLVHLKSEFSAESLVFWQAVATYKKKGERPAEEMIREIDEIFATYIVPAAPYQLNTSMASIEDTQDLYQSAKTSGNGFLDVFDALVTEVVALMKSDPLPRFLRSEAGRKYAFQFKDHSQSAKTKASHIDRSDHSTNSILSESPHDASTFNSALAIDIEPPRRLSLSTGTLPIVS